MGTLSTAQYIKVSQKSYYFSDFFILKLENPLRYFLK
jgi:hypothetical protein